MHQLEQDACRFLQIPLMLVEQLLVKIMHGRRLQPPLLLAFPVASLGCAAGAVYSCRYSYRPRCGTSGEPGGHQDG